MSTLCKLATLQRLVILLKHTIAYTVNMNVVIHCLFSIGLASHVRLDIDINYSKQSIIHLAFARKDTLSFGYAK